MTTPNQPITPAPRRSIWRWLPLGLIAVLAACDSAVTAPVAFNEARCAVPQAVRLNLTPQPFSQQALRPALLHAAGPMASVLGPGQLTNELRRSIELLGTESGARLHDTHCRLLIIASTALAEIPETPQTAPDRVGIQLVLALLAGALSEATP